MVDESGSVSAALMHLFYYQQGLFVDEAQPGSLLREVASGVSASTPGSSQPPPWQQPQASASTPPEDDPEPSAAPLSEPPAAEPAADPDGARPADASVLSEQVHALYERRAELQWCLETGSLRAQNEALESQVLKMQEDFIALQDDFKDMKERCGEQLESLSKALEAQQVVTRASEKRVVCTEDLVRFHEEQRRLMAGHWKSQCQMKDERIRYLNLQLTEYTADWCHSGVPKPTEASLSHELHCLQDRHTELQAHRARRGAHLEALGAQLAAARAEERELREAETEARTGDALDGKLAGLRGQLRLLGERRSARERLPAPGEGGPPWPHSCIWRDELDVRERQLEKITAQLDRTNSALHAAQAALAVQRERHEEMKSKHREAEAGFRESERQRARWQGHCLEFRRAEAELRRALEARASGASSSSAPSGPQASGNGSVLGSAIVASSGGASGQQLLRGGAHRAGLPPLSSRGVLGGSAQGSGDLPDRRSGSRADAGSPLKERIAAIGRETRRLVLRRREEEREAREELSEAAEADVSSRPAADAEDASAEGASEAARRASRAQDAATVREP